MDTARNHPEGVPVVVEEVLGLIAQVGLEGPLLLVAGGALDQPALLVEGVLMFRSAYHAAEGEKREKERKAAERKGRR